MKEALIILLIGMCGCSGEVPSEELHYPLEEEMESSFSRFYEAVEYASVPSMPSLGLPVEPGSVINLRSALFQAGAGSAEGTLLENGFAVYPMQRPTDDPVQAFERLSDTGLPVYVSSGIPLHMLHIFFDQILQQVETDYLYTDLLTLCETLYESALSRSDLLAAAYFAVPLTFLDPGFQPHESIVETVGAETGLMRAHAGFTESPVFGYHEDYSQYVPRGHYTASRELANFFMAMMFMGRLTFILEGGTPHGPDESFLVSSEAADDMTRTALLIVSDLNTLEADGVPLRDIWRRVYEVTAFFAGFAEDLSVMEYQAAAGETGGETFDSGLLRRDSFLEGFRRRIAMDHPGPSIYSGTGQSVIMPDGSGEFDPEGFTGLLAKTAGFRLFGQRYTPDSDILGRFVFPSVGRNPAGEQRFMPSGLDVAGAFRFAGALDIIEGDGTSLFSHYTDTLESMQRMIDGFSTDDWHSTLYMCWLHSLRLLAEPRGQGYPDFMQTAMWNRCTLSTFLASWAMLRHDTILYAKQSYTATAGCAFPGDEQPVPSAGFVEPVPEVYAELRGTLIMARNGLEHYGILDEELETRFDRADDLLADIQEIAEKELYGEMLTERDADFLKGFASSLEYAIAWGETTTEGLETSLIADVHTDQNSGRVLEVASGNLDNCVVIYRRPDGVVEAAMGPVLSYYEFTWPMNDRLTDRAWRDMLAAGSPERPGWTDAYMVSPE